MSIDQSRRTGHHQTGQPVETDSGSSQCRDHASFVKNEDGEVLSECCDAPPISVDADYDMER